MNRRGVSARLIALAIAGTVAGCSTGPGGSDGATPAASVAPTSSSSSPSTAGPSPSAPAIDDVAFAHELEQVNALEYVTGNLYDVPDPLPPGAPGELIRLQVAAIRRDARAYRVLYHSGSVDGTTDVAVSGLVWVPQGPPPAGGFPILTYGSSYNGSGDDCPLSREVDWGDDPILRDGALARGYVVAITDEEGRGTRYPYRTAVPESAAHSILDAARAARDLLGPDASDVVAVAGYSLGGDNATATLLDGPQYAPELDVRGVVSFDGGTDHRQAVEAMRDADIAPASYVAAVVAYAEAYGLDAADILTPEAIRDAAAIGEAGCGDFREQFGDRDAAATLAGSPLDFPDWRRWVDAHSPTSAPYPLLLVLAELDNADRSVGMGILTLRLCARGGHVELRRLPDVTHDDLLGAAATDALDWIEDRVAGVAAPACAA
jgi:hypothetical protein